MKCNNKKINKIKYSKITKTLYSIKMKIKNIK